MTDEQYLKAYSNIVPLIRQGVPWREISDKIKISPYRRIRKILGIKYDCSDKYMLERYKDILILVRKGASLETICQTAYPITSYTLRKLRKAIGISGHATLSDETLLLKYSDVVSYIISGEKWDRIRERYLCSQSTYYRLKNIIDRKNGKNKSPFVLPERW